MQGTERVVIVGGGVGGLACAVLLAARGLDVTVIEDACASFAPPAHEFSVGTILPMFASVVSADDYLATLSQEG